MIGITKKNRLKLLFSLFFAVFIIALFTVIAFISIQQMRGVTDMVCRSLGLPIAQRAVALVDGDAFERLCQTLDENDPFYEDTRQKLLALKEETGCKYLYTMDRIGADDSDFVYRFIIDGSAVPGDPSFSPLGAEEDVSEYEWSFKATWDNQTFQYGGLDMQVFWGWVISAYAPILNSKGNMVGIVGVDFDAELYFTYQRTQLKWLVIITLAFVIVGMAVYIFLFKSLDAQNQRLMELAAAAEAASQAKSSFLASISHEIRTPMNAVLGMAELLLRRDLPGDAYREVMSIKQAGSNLLSIINDILDFSKIESGKMDIVPAEYQLASLLNDSAGIVRNRIEEKHLDFTVTVDSSLPAVLWGDMARVRQVLLNLLSNAIKYTHQGGIKLRVGGEYEDRETVLLRLAVEDTGIGLKPEDREKLFGEFSRFDMKRNQSVEGTGLGLAISRNLCRLMGGDITVESEYGKGSIFTAVIPQRIQDAAPIGPVWESKIHSPSAGKTQMKITFTAPKANLLVVDDIETNLNVVRGLLAPYQMNITTVLSGAEAVELAQRQSWDLILMDHMMPGMNGIEATARIRAWEVEQREIGEKGREGIPIVALTANAISGMKEMFLEMGFNEYLSKPVEIAKLDETIARWIPEGKKVRGASVRREGPVKDAGFEISGVDAQKGIAATGGTVEGYRSVLKSFRKDAEERLPLLRDFLVDVSQGKNDKLSAFVTQVHALKSASASIGAAKVSEEAARLEAAGKAALAGGVEDTAVIRETLPGFIERLEALAGGIGEAIKDEESGVSNGELPEKAHALLTELAAALEAQKVDDIDRLLEELNRQNLDSQTREIIDAVSDDVLMAEYDKALESITKLKECENK